MAVIAIDVDLTVCAIDKLWWEWLCNVTNTLKPFPTEDVEYDLSNYFRKELGLNARDGLDFFRQEGVYDFAEPVTGCVEAIKELSEAGNTIIFVSAIKGNHHKSKYFFLNRHFGEHMDAFIATKEKNYVKCDVLIDDRNMFLNKVDCLKIKYVTKYTQCEELNPEPLTHVIDDWSKIPNLISSLRRWSII